MLFYVIVFCSALLCSVMLCSVLSTVLLCPFGFSVLFCSVSFPGLLDLFCSVLFCSALCSIEFRSIFSSSRIHVILFPFMFCSAFPSSGIHVTNFYRMNPSFKFISKQFPVSVETKNNSGLSTFMYIIY